MTIIKKISLFHLVLTALLLRYADASAQSIDHLVRIHSAKNTEMRPLDVERVDDHIYMVYEYIHRDTVKIDGHPLGLDTLPSEQMPIVISQFDTTHQLLRTGVLTASRPFRGAIAYQNVRYHGDRIYLFVSIYDKELQYNGETIWTSTPTEDLFIHDRWYIMVTLDSHLNFIVVKGIDHWYSGFEDIAFGEDRMYLFGIISKGRYDEQDTIDVDGYKLVTMGDGHYKATNFVLTYDLTSNEVINGYRIDLDTVPGYINTQGICVGSDGSVFQLLNAFQYMIVTEDGDQIRLNKYYYNSVVLKYNKDGSLIDWEDFDIPTGEVYLRKMAADTEGNLLLSGRFVYSLGLDGEMVISLPLPRASLIMSIDADDLNLRWYDFLSVQHSNTASIYDNDFTIDKDDNVYMVSSFRSGVKDAVDKAGNKLKAGIYIHKYNKNGEIIKKTLWANRMEDPNVLVSACHGNNLSVFKMQEGERGDYDSIVNMELTFFNEIQLFQHTLGDISSSIDHFAELDIELNIYPNPVGKCGILKIRSPHQMQDLPYTLLDIFGRVVAQGSISHFGEIPLCDLKLQSGIHFIAFGEDKTMIHKFIILN